MKKINLFLLVLLSLNGSIAFSQTIIFQQQILTSTDDAEEKFDGSYVSTSSSDIEMAYDTWNDQGLQKIGLRFDKVTIPSNATITNAYIQFTAKGDTSGTIAMTIKGENTAQSIPFENKIYNISNRPTTNANVIWNLTKSWADEETESIQKTPNISAIVSEIITSNGWKNGNPITFIINGTGDRSNYRKAYSFDGNASLAAKLVVAYTSNSNHDLALSAIINPTTNSYANPATPVQVKISNYGNSIASNYDVSYSINGNLIATETSNTPLSIGESTIFTFTQTADLKTTGNYNLSASVTINDDEDTSNNTLATSISVINEIEDIFFTKGSSWRYLDTGTNPGDLWNTSDFNARSWKEGIAHFGFGEGDEATIINEGLATYYFRKKIDVPDVTALNDVYLHIIHDDGAMVYINGKEVVRTETMPLGVIEHTTTARQRANTTNENNFYTYKVNASYFVSGTNTIAISIHNSSLSSSDLSFDCYITPNHTYQQDGPYVQYHVNDIIVSEVTPNGLVSNTYTSKSEVTLTCKLPHMGTSFSFPLKTEINTEVSVYPTTPSKFLVISDFDGNMEAFTMLLKGEGIIDNQFNWTYGDGHLIITGDLFDRGFHITECMWLLYKLESEAIAKGGKVHLIIGNHEMMNMTDDWRYVETKYFNNAHLMGKRMLDLYDASTELGRWLRSKNIIEKIGNYAFMHGGISKEVAELNLTYDQINNYGRLEMNSAPCYGDCATVTGGDGIYWSRDMAKETYSQETVDAILTQFDVKRIIIGHTKDASIRALYNEKVMAIDMYHIDNFYDGYMEALQFQIGCFYLFHTDGIKANNNYTQIGNCDNTTLNLLDVNKENNFKVYPNPTNRFLNIQLPTNLLENYAYTIVDQTGKQIATGKLYSALSKIKVDSYAAGKYILTLKSSTSTITGYFILKR
ncbi:metallophosphoesterase [Tenacibaculum maritimum]|uniref:metallophosphoesterase n=1 Tax=Tenacibaculum maritimum TaxID=107401 RepID=UPI0012E52B1F|nr:metallophosphoesterase [Tenacibaculum maritimum]CAA0163118.1 Putative Metallo-dependent phosphatase containing a C-terminal secretion signal [Tenacibaculum maritimum]